VIDVSSSTDITKITSRSVRARLRPVAERVHEERDPLGTMDASVLNERSDQPDPFDALIEAMLPIVPKLGTAAQAVRNAAARREFLADFPTLVSTEVAKAAGSDAKNAAALATRWRKEHRVFAVSWGGELRYPAFQFDDAGKPLPAVKAVIDAFGVQISPWQLAIWFATPSPHLPREDRPIRFLSDPDQLVAAARAERELPEF
jgi:hypothetical protein